MSAFTVAVNPAVSSTASRRTTLNPDNEKLTAYVPGRRSTTLYWPSLSVTTVRTFSMSAGLAASTVTPGSTAPVVSRTTPAIAPVVADCARAIPGLSTIAQRIRNRVVLVLIIRPSPFRKDTGALYTAERPGLLRLSEVQRSRRATILHRRGGGGGRRLSRSAPPRGIHLTERVYRTPPSLLRRGGPRRAAAFVESDDRARRGIAAVRCRPDRPQATIRKPHAGAMRNSRRGRERCRRSSITPFPSEAGSRCRATATEAPASARSTPHPFQ